MFALTPRHMKALEAAPDAEFAFRLVEHVRGVFPEQTAGIAEGKLLQLVRAARERARVLDITTEKNIALFVDLGFGLGEDFETNPAYSRISHLLADRHAIEDVKMYRVYLELSALE